MASMSSRAASSSYELWKDGRFHFWANASALPGVRDAIATNS